MRADSKNGSKIIDEIGRLKEKGGEGGLRILEGFKERS